MNEITEKISHCTPELIGGPLTTWPMAHLVGQFMESRGWEVVMEDTMDHLEPDLAVEEERDWMAGLDYLMQFITVTQAAAEFGRKPDSLRHALQRGALYGEKSGGTWLVTRAAVADYLYRRDEDYLAGCRRPQELSKAL